MKKLIKKPQAKTTVIAAAAMSVIGSFTPIPAKADPTLAVALGGTALLGIILHSFGPSATPVAPPHRNRIYPPRRFAMAGPAVHIAPPMARVRYAPAPQQATIYSSVSPVIPQQVNHYYPVAPQPQPSYRFTATAVPVPMAAPIPPMVQSTTMAMGYPQVRAFPQPMQPMVSRMQPMGQPMQPMVSQMQPTGQPMQPMVSQMQPTTGQPMQPMPGYGAACCQQF